MLMNFESKLQVGGRFKLGACQKDDDGVVIPGTERDLTGWFDNLITDAGMEMLKSDKFMAYIRVGSGSTAPAVTDTALVNQVASVAVATEPLVGPYDFTTDPLHPWCSARVSKQFGKGVAAGNLSELAIAPTATGLVFCRSLIKDSNGNPTTITVLAIEYLTVTYDWRVYFDLTYTNDQVFTIDGVNYTATYMLAGVNTSGASNWAQYGPWATSYKQLAAYSVAIPSPGGSPSGSKYGQNATTTNGGVGLNYIDVSVTFGEGEANFSIAAISMYDDSYRIPKTCGINISPALVKDNTRQVSVTIRHAWARYVP